MSSLFPVGSRVFIDAASPHYPDSVAYVIEVDDIDPEYSYCVAPRFNAAAVEKAQWVRREHVRSVPIDQLQAGDPVVAHDPITFSITHEVGYLVEVEPVPNGMVAISKTKGASPDIWVRKHLVTPAR